MYRTSVSCFAVIMLVFLTLNVVVGQPSNFKILPRPSHALTPTTKELAQNTNRFAFQFLNEVNKTAGAENICVSPLSVALALAMTTNGAAGNTEAAMKKTLQLSAIDMPAADSAYFALREFLQQCDPDVRMEIANSIWYEQSFSVKSTFLDINTEFFGAEVMPADFRNPRTVKLINQWVDKNTNGKIQRIINQIDPLTMMILINAIYFKGGWVNEFKEHDTKPDWFILPDGSNKQCRMMNQDGKFTYGSRPKCQIIDLPYGNGSFCMTIILPASGIDTDSLLSRLSPDIWNQWLTGCSSAFGSISLPKFTFEYQELLNGILAAMGMGVAFDIRKADFTNITDDIALAISQVLHKTYISVDEQGTEAAAVTSVGMMMTAYTPPKPKFTMRVDRPFLFAIRERNSGAILFLGKVVDPTQD